MGCSSSGKSTFIANVLIPFLVTNRDDLELDDISVIFAGQLKSNYALGQKKCAIVHYNSLLDFDANPQSETLDIGNEYVFKNVINDDFDEVFYCYTPDQILLNRIKQRRFIEPVLRGDRKPDYPTERVMRSLKKILQKDVLIEAHRLMSHLGDHFSVVLSQNRSSMIIPVEYFITAPRLEFLEKISSDEHCELALLQPHLHKYSPLAAGCAKFLSAQTILGSRH